MRQHLVYVLTVLNSLIWAYVLWSSDHAAIHP